MSEGRSRLTQRSMHHGITQDQKVVRTTDVGVTLSPEDHLCEVRHDTLLAADFTITLPSVAEAAGMFYKVILLTAADAIVVTVQDAGDDSRWPGYELKLAASYGLFYSTGRMWHSVGCSCGAPTGGLIARG